MKLFTIHGWSFGPSVWRGTPFESAEHITLPGHGESYFISSDILGLSKEIGEYLPKDSTLVGWSLGATLAVVTASLYPDRVKELILFAPTVKFSGVSQPEVVVKRFLKKLRRDFEKTVREFRALCSEKDFPLPELEERKATELLESFSFLDISEFAEKLSIPVRIVVGEMDRVTGVLGAHKLHRIVESSTLLLFPREDHLTVLHSYHH
jgi:pimeloyl-[acyl-carrier protein] methyl ester esterase